MQAKRAKTKNINVKKHERARRAVPPGEQSRLHPIMPGEQSPHNIRSPQVAVGGDELVEHPELGADVDEEQQLDEYVARGQLAAAQLARQAAALGMK